MKEAQNLIEALQELRAAPRDVVDAALDLIATGMAAELGSEPGAAEFANQLVTALEDEVVMHLISELAKKIHAKLTPEGA